MLDTALIASCAALVLAGVVMVWRWGGAAPPTPAATGPLLRRGARYTAIMLAAGAVAGVLAAGAGGRLVMRLLALTSAAAQGAVTEGGATVGEISVEGTIGLVLFAGLPAGVLTGALYAGLRPVLPAGRGGGALVGLLMLVLAGATVEPLRADNFDFNLVGPDWLSVLAFAAVAAFQGMLVVAITQRLHGARAAPRTPRVALAGGVAVAALLLLTLPTFAAAVGEILTSG